jgi:hypothetical protein
MPMTGASFIILHFDTPHNFYSGVVAVLSSLLGVALNLRREKYIATRRLDRARRRN